MLRSSVGRNKRSALRHLKPASHIRLAADRP
ncbi:MAG: hypothetical protein QOG83_3791, partial [Alphaproteobacteria bacterium]|nr:hypothetical protein [Alphaproteobacteria bacterium]